MSQKKGAIIFDNSGCRNLEIYISQIIYVFNLLLSHRSLSNMFYHLCVKCYVEMKGF